MTSEPSSSGNFTSSSPVRSTPPTLPIPRNNSPRSQSPLSPQSQHIKTLRAYPKKENLLQINADFEKLRKEFENSNFSIPTSSNSPSSLTPGRKEKQNSTIPTSPSNSTSPVPPPGRIKKPISKSKKEDGVFVAPNRKTEAMDEQSHWWWDLISSPKPVAVMDVVKEYKHELAEELLKLQEYPDYNDVRQLVKLSEFEAFVLGLDKTRLKVLHEIELKQTEWNVHDGFKLFKMRGGRLLEHLGISVKEQEKQNSQNRNLRKPKPPSPANERSAIPVQKKDVQNEDVVPSSTPNASSITNGSSHKEPTSSDKEPTKPPTFSRLFTGYIEEDVVPAMPNASSITNHSSDKEATKLPSVSRLKARHWREYSGEDVVPAMPNASSITNHSSDKEAKLPSVSRLRARHWREYRGETFRSDVVHTCSSG